MTAPTFDHARDAAWLSALADGELDAEREAAVVAHLGGCAACRDELAALRRFDLVMGSLRLRDAPPEAWEKLAERLSHRSARRAGWLLFTAGAVVTAVWAAWQGVVALLAAPDLPWWVKLSVLVAGAGAILLMASVVRERVHARRRTRYKDVVR